jgi:hypothetical protein
MARKKHIPTIGIHEDKFIWINWVRESIGEEQFNILSEDEKDSKAKALYEAWYNKELGELYAHIIIDHVLRDLYLNKIPEPEEYQIYYPWEKQWIPPRW